MHLAAANVRVGARHVSTRDSPSKGRVTKASLPRPPGTLIVLAAKVAVVDLAVERRNASVVVEVAARAAVVAVPHAKVDPDVPAQVSAHVLVFAALEIRVVLGPQAASFVCELLGLFPAVAPGLAAGVAGRGGRGEGKRGGK